MHRRFEDSGSRTPNAHGSSAGARAACPVARARGPRIHAGVRLPLGTLSAENVPHDNNLMAGALIVVIPEIVLFPSLQRYFVNGPVGAVKG